MLESFCFIEEDPGLRRGGDEGVELVDIGFF